VPIFVSVRVSLDYFLCFIRRVQNNGLLVPSFSSPVIRQFQGLAFSAYPKETNCPVHSTQCIISYYYRSYTGEA